MKYLKRFNEDLSNTSDTVVDICIDLQDIGFIITPPYDGRSPSKSITIQMDKYNYFQYDKVKETVDRIKEFLGPKLHSVYISKGKGWYKHGFTNMKKPINAVKITWDENIE